MSDEMVLVEVGDADRTGEPASLQRQQPTPAVHVLALLTRGPVDQVEIDVVEAEAFQARGQRVLGRLVALVGGGQFGGDEQLLARHTRRRDRTADRGLVAVGGGGVEQSVAGLQRRRHRLLGLGVRQLADAETDDRHRVVVVQSDRRNCSRRRHVTYPCLLAQLKVRGSGPSRVPSPSDEMDAMSCSVSSKSNTSKLLTIRSGVTDFGMTILPSWICHLISTWAGVFPRLSETAVTIGSSKSDP